MGQAGLLSENSSWRRTLAVVLTAILLLAVGFGVGRLGVPSAGTPGDTSAEAGFARDMQVHHEQAVELSLLVRDRTDDENLLLLADDIAIAQAQQSGQMYAWLAEWGLSQAPAEPRMTWMTRPALDGSHGHDDESPAHEPGEPMPGLATFEQIEQLKSVSGVEAERLFLELMIEHHKGGVAMAEAVLERTGYPVVVDLARGMVTVQDSEIDLMQGMLERLA